MIFKIQNKKIKELLEGRKELLNLLNVINREISDSDAERKKIAFKMERNKEKVNKLLKKHLGKEIQVSPPIETISVVKLEEGYISVEVTNVVDDFKNALIKQFKNKK